MAEEVPEHPRLLQLEAEVLADVGQFEVCSLADKARVQKLSLAIQDKLSGIRALTRDLELLVEELDSDEERQQVAALLAQHKVEYERIQAAFKAAALAQRAAALRSAAEERRELLAGGDAAARQRKLQTEADAVALAEDVTGGLRRTRQVLAEELEHTGATLAAMEASHTSLGRTRDEYQGQHTRLKRSRGLLGTLNWQTKSETYMLWMGLSLFVLVCAYVFQKRAGHFVPDRLKPTALLRAAGIMGGARPQPVPAPQGRLKRQDALPRQHLPPEPAGAPAAQAPAVDEQRYLPPTPSPAMDPPAAAAAGEEQLPYQVLPEEHFEEHSVYEPAAAEAGAWPEEAAAVEQTQEAGEHHFQPAEPEQVHEEQQQQQQQAHEEPEAAAHEIHPEPQQEQLEPAGSAEPAAVPEPAAVAYEQSEPAAVEEPAAVVPERQHVQDQEPAAVAHEQPEPAAVEEPHEAEPQQHHEPPPAHPQEPPAQQPEAAVQQEQAEWVPEVLEPVPQPPEQAANADAESGDAAVWPEGAPAAAAATGEQQPGTAAEVPDGGDGGDTAGHAEQGPPVAMDNSQDDFARPPPGSPAAAELQAEEPAAPSTAAALQQEQAHGEL